MTIAKKVWRIVSTILGLLNFIVFVYFLNFVLKEFETFKSSAYNFDSLSVQIAMLDVMLVAMSIGLAVVGFIGYNSLKDICEKKAEEVAVKVINTRMNDYEGSIHEQLPIKSRTAKIENSNVTKLDQDAEL